MRNIFQRLTSEKTTTTNTPSTQPVLRELNENELQQVAGGHDLHHHDHHHHPHNHKHDHKKK